MIESSHLVLDLTMVRLWKKLMPVLVFEIFFILLNMASGRVNNILVPKNYKSGMSLAGGLGRGGLHNFWQINYPISENSSAGNYSFLKVENVEIFT